MDISAMESPPQSGNSLLDLPAEIRIAILEYVFDANANSHGLITAKKGVHVILDECYRASQQLQLLLVCRQMYHDGATFGMSSTTFVMTSLFGDVPQRLSTLHLKQIQAIRNITFVADSRQFRKLVDWRQHPFDLSALRLDTMTIVLHRSSFWHYLFDYTEGVVRVLRTLQGVKRIVVVRNNARVKGSLKTWYNRLVGLIMKVDHHQRYERKPAKLEEVWWTWNFDDAAQTFALEAQPPKLLTDEETYFKTILPIMEQLKLSVESEEWNPDPRSRNMYY